jgi:acylphosphatase
MTVSSPGAARPESRMAADGPAEAPEYREWGAAEPVRMTAWVRGQVQGVGFRWFTRASALRIGGLEGFVVNLADGRVQVVAEGGREDCGRLLHWLRAGDTPGRVTGVTEIWNQPRGGYGGFAIR